MAIVLLFRLFPYWTLMTDNSPGHAIQPHGSQFPWPAATARERISSSQLVGCSWERIIVPHSTDIVSACACWQVLISLQGLVLVEARRVSPDEHVRKLAPWQDPYFNEPGHECWDPTPECCRLLQAWLSSASMCPMSCRGVQ